MKTAIKIFSLFFLILFGCSKDDNGTEQTVIPPNKKFLNTITNEDGSVILSLEYNAEKNVERIKIGEEGLFIYGYEANRIISLDIYLDESLNFTFTYDANGHLNSFIKDDVITPVTYNASQNFYLYALENGDEETIFLDNDGDAKKFVSYDKSENKNTTTSLLYAGGDYRGSLTNTNNPLLATGIATPYYKILFLIYNLSKKPIRTLTGGGIMDFENTYDEQGFLKSSTFGSDSNYTTYNYNYIKL